MNDINRALVEIRLIRRQVAESSQFHGYGPLTLSATSVIALLTGAAQGHWLPVPAAHPAAYVALWMTTGTFCAALIASQMIRRADRLHANMAPEMVRLAVTQFAPAALAGAVLPFVLLQAPSGIFWVLPGLWQIIFSLGVFASLRSLPRPMLLAGFWFLLAGFACILRGDSRALAPSSMSIPFSLGMVYVAAVHYFSGSEGRR